MMLITTLFIAVILIAALYFAAIRFVPWPALAYVLVTAVGAACMIGGVHFAYVGIEVAGLGSLLVWVHFRLWRKTTAHA